MYSVSPCFDTKSMISQAKLINSRYTKPTLYPYMSLLSKAYPLNIFKLFSVKCPPPTSYRCSTTLKNECEDTDTCSVGKICCFDGCRRRCIDDKTSSSLTGVI